MALRGVIPKNHVDGFIAELIKHNDPIVQGDNLDGTLIDYCYEIAVTCDGSNPYYGRKSRATFVITQFADTAAEDGIVAGDDVLPIIILSRDEVLGSITVVEAKKKGQQCAIAIFSILNLTDDTRRTLSWIVRESEASVLN